MYKAMEFKGVLGKNEIKSVSEFSGKNVELSIREIPDPSQVHNPNKPKSKYHTTDVTPDQFTHTFNVDRTHTDSGK
ncbi:hypothetical protein EWI07_01495 [Sporolactobacillus sp. THM7-4]|nr:hypothetical protein EWI07_01495 [Sporolactobacillus sp. THM7-4]